MESSKLKNMVVLKNLPSNIIDEAIIVLKTSKKIKKVQKIEQKRNTSNNKNVKKDKDYILKEAEMLVNNYISKVEKKDNKNFFNNKKMKTKYEKLKRYSIAMTIMCVLQAIVIICH